MDYLKKNKEEFNASIFLNKLLMSNLKALFPEINEQLKKANVYGDGRVDYSLFEGLMFNVVKKAIDQGDVRTFAIIMKIYDVIGKSEIRGENSYNVLVDAIAEVQQKSTCKENNNRKRTLPPKSGFEGDLY